MSLDFVEMELLLVSKPTEIAGILVLKWLKLLISFSVFNVLLKTNYNHQIFKIFIYFVGILMPLYILLYHIKRISVYGIHQFLLKLIENGFNLFFAIILLIFIINIKLIIMYKPNP